MSYQGLLDILRSNVQDYVWDWAQPPVACPNDGEPLVVHPRTGQWYCRFDGWEWNGLFGSD